MDFGGALFDQETKSFRERHRTSGASSDTHDALKVAVHVLRRHTPATVWAIDFHKPQRPVDGIYPYVFMVRDLASGSNLLSLPVPSRQLHHVIAALSALFENLGAPLVLKSDCEFDTIRFQLSDEHANQARQLLAQLLIEHNVFHLLSPPYTPEYNASIEAGIGSFQTRAHHEAARHGHAGEWNCEDVEAARLQANELARPWGHNADTPDTAWVARSPISSKARAAFATSGQQFQSEERHTVAVARRNTTRPQGRKVLPPCGHQPCACCSRPFIVPEKANYSAH